MGHRQSDAGTAAPRVLLLSAAPGLRELVWSALRTPLPAHGQPGSMPAPVCHDDAVPAGHTELVVAGGLAELDRLPREERRFDLAFVDGSDLCAAEFALLTAALRPRVREPGIIGIECGQRLTDAGCDAILVMPVDAGRIRAISRLLSEASRACAERDLALAQLEVSARAGGTCQWRWNRRSGEARWCAAMAQLMALDAEPGSGGVDLVWTRIHPQDRARVCSAMEAASPGDLHGVEYRILMADGSVRRVRQEFGVKSAADGCEWVVCAVQDLDADDRSSETVRKLAYFDPLTALPNRSFLNEHLRNVLVHARRHERLIAILHVNLDGFKRFNDVLGHSAGDRLLQEVAGRLQGSVRDSDCVAREHPAMPWRDEADEDAVTRFGADEFIVVLSEVASSQDPEAVAERIIARMREPVSLDGRELTIGASIGIAVYPNDAHDEDALLRNAALAVQSAKRAGRNTWRSFEPSLLTPSVDRLNLEAKLRHAMEQGGGLSLHYQPKVDARSAEVVGAEALLRWQHPELGSIPPAQFIPIAEESGLILPLGEWVVSEVCDQLAAWRDAGLAKVPVSINVSAQQLYDQGLCRKISAALERSGLKPRDLEFEITESILMDDIGDGEQRLAELKALGSLISMDDFGTGYSSLSYLKRLPIDVVKIDRSFVRDILGEVDDQAILRAIISMAHQLRLRIVAEGVEDEAQMHLLQQMDCDFIQGYVVSRPVPPEVFAARFLTVGQQLAS